MSLYNQLFGTNPMAPLLLSMINLKPGDVGRFRDCYYDGEHIVVFTRMGGGNREEYQSDIEDLQEHPGYVKDQDEEIDCTYASFFFELPAGFKELMDAEKDKTVSVSPMKRFESLLEGMKSGAKTPDVEHAIKVGESIIKQIEEAQKGPNSGPSIIEV